MSRTRLVRAAGVGALLVAASMLATTAGAQQLSADQTLTVGVGNFPPTLDPHKFTADGPLRHFFEPLVRRNGTEFEPVIAESWSNPDELTWEFVIDADAKFSDGSPVTSTDVKASVERIVAQKGSLAPLWSTVTEIQTPDERTIRFVTSAPLGTMLNTASIVLIGKAGAMDDEGYWSQPVGSGKFVVEEFVPDERLVLAANDTYWGNNATALESITFSSIPEQSARITAVATGEIDIATDISADALTEIRGTDGVEVVIAPSYSYHLLWFNSSREPFNNPLVRRAMWHAVDVKSAVEDLYGELGSVAEGPIPQTVLGAPTLQPYEYNPELAKQLLAEAGLPDGFSTSLQWPDFEGDTLRSLLRTFISEWAKVGIVVEPTPKERAIWLEDLNALKWNINSQSNTVTTGDADFTLGRLYVCSANRMGYCNAELDELLAKAKASLDQSERGALYQQAGEIIWKDAVGIFPVQLSLAVAHSPKVQGLVLDPSGRHDYSGITLTE